MLPPFVYNDFIELRWINPERPILFFQKSEIYLFFSVVLFSVKSGRVLRHPLIKNLLNTIMYGIARYASAPTIIHLTPSDFKTSALYLAIKMKILYKAPNDTKRMCQYRTIL